jgi:AcrR family transcriptional regulator
MGRRKLVNIDRKIIAEVHREAFKYGIGSVSTKDIAHKLKISEPVIFSHFGTKEGLMRSAFEAAWKSMPHMLAFPSELTAEGDRKAFLEYKKKIEEDCDKPLEVNYIASFVSSSFYDYAFVSEIEKTYRNELLQIFGHLAPGIDEQALSIVAERFIESSIATTNHFVLGHHPKDEETEILFYGLRIYGVVGVLGMKGAARPADIKRMIHEKE